MLRTRPAQLSPSPFPANKEDATPDEIFVADGWYKTWKASKYAGTNQANCVFHDTLNTIRALANRGMQIYILEGTTVDTLVGFIAFEIRHDNRYVLHYVYVKEMLRNRGFGKKLMGLIVTRGLFYTHRTPDSKLLGLGNVGHEPKFARRKNL